MAVTPRRKLDAGKLRADFPIFEQDIRGKPLAYLDSAVSSHKPRQVLDKLRTFYETSVRERPSRRLHALEIATAEYEGAREKVAQFVNAPRGARAHLHARRNGEHQSRRLRRGASTIWGLGTSSSSPSSSTTPISSRGSTIAKRTGAAFVAIPLDDQGELRFDTLDEIAQLGNIKVVANNLVSNALARSAPSVFGDAHERRFCGSSDTTADRSSDRTSAHHAIAVKSARLPCTLPIAVGAGRLRLRRRQPLELRPFP